MRTVCGAAACLAVALLGFSEEKVPIPEGIRETIDRRAAYFCASSEAAKKFVVAFSRGEVPQGDECALETLVITVPQAEKTLTPVKVKAFKGERWQELYMIPILASGRKQDA